MTITDKSFKQPNAQERFMKEQLERTTQVRVRPRNIVDGHAPGSIVWMTPSRARMFASMGVIDVIGDPNIKIGPQEVKEGDPGKKSFDARSSGHSTDSASSQESGKEQQSSASAVDQVSQPSNATGSKPPENGSAQQGSAPLQSTTPTDLRRGQTSTTSPTPHGGNGTRRKTPSRTSQG